MNGAPSAMVSPGLWGFLAFFVLALALYLLMRNMNARMRRMSYRSEELLREAQAEAAGKQSGTDGSAEPAPEGPAEPGDEGRGGEPTGGSTP